MNQIAAEEARAAKRRQSRPKIAAVQADPVAKDAWRAVPLANTKIPSNIIAILDESSYRTIGDIANLTSSGNVLTDIKESARPKLRRSRTRPSIGRIIPSSRLRPRNLNPRPKPEAEVQPSPSQRSRVR